MTQTIIEIFETTKITLTLENTRIAMAIAAADGVDHHHLEDMKGVAIGIEIVRITNLPIETILAEA